MNFQPITVTVSEAKAQLGELLKRVGKGTTFTITKHDQPIAQLVKLETDRTAQRAAATAELRALRARYTLGGLDARTLRAEGRG